MKNAYKVVSFLALAIVISVSQLGYAAETKQKSESNFTQTTQAPHWHVFFSPKGGCTEAIVSIIDQAKVSVLVQAYSFTSYPITEALINAQKRGVKVEAIIDGKQLHSRGVKLGLLAKAGIPVSLDSKHAIAHNKVMVIDSRTVITGSFNFTAAAEKSNAENLLIVEDPALAKEYALNWSKHRAHSEEFNLRENNA